MSIQRYPLAWPVGWPRAKWRSAAKFGTRGNGSDLRRLSADEAMKRLARELDLIGARDEILSTNIEIRLDGGIKGGRDQPGDPGAAIYFKFNGRDTVLACDKWDRVADNIVALAKHIDALRGQERWGVGTVAQAFAGYQALPAPEQWFQILGVSSNATKAQIRAAWRAKIDGAHPDRGGTTGQAARINSARDDGLAVANG